MTPEPAPPLVQPIGLFRRVLSIVLGVLAFGELLLAGVLFAMALTATGRDPTKTDVVTGLAASFMAVTLWLWSRRAAGDQRPFVVAANHWLMLVWASALGLSSALLAITRALRQPDVVVVAVAGLALVVLVLRRLNRRRQEGST